MNPIKRYRLAKGMTQKEFAKKLGIDQGSLSEWEHGNYWPSPKHIPPLAEALGLTALDLIDKLELERIPWRTTDKCEIT